MEELFNEILKKYQESETCVIENMSGRIKEELEELEKEINEYKERFKKLNKE